MRQHIYIAHIHVYSPEQSYEERVSSGWRGVGLCGVWCGVWCIDMRMLLCQLWPLWTCLFKVPLDALHAQALFLRLEPAVHGVRVVAINLHTHPDAWRQTTGRATAARQ